MAPNPYILEVHRNTKVERGDPEEQMATYQRGNSTQEDITVKNTNEQRNLGTLAFNLKCEWKKQSTILRKQKCGWGGGGGKNETVCRIERL
jgi:hypothetical protein